MQRQRTTDYSSSWSSHIGSFLAYIECEFIESFAYNTSTTVLYINTITTGTLLPNYFNGSHVTVNNESLLTNPHIKHIEYLDYNIKIEVIQL